MDEEAVAGACGCMDEEVVDGACGFGEREEKGEKT